MEKTEETKVSETLLQNCKEVKVGGVSYMVAPPSIATLVMVSEQISYMPALETCRESDVLTWSLRNAKDCKFLTDILATIILGAKKIKGERRLIKKYLFGLIQINKIEQVNFKSELSERLINDYTPSELSKLTSVLLESMDIGAFFFTISFLQEVNLTKPTKVPETTVSGQ